MRVHIWPICDPGGAVLVEVRETIAGFLTSSRQEQFLRTILLGRLASRTIGGFVAALDAHAQMCAGISAGVPEARYSAELRKHSAIQLTEACQPSEAVPAMGRGSR